MKNVANRPENKKKPASCGLRFNVMPTLQSTLQPELSARCGVWKPMLSAWCLQCDLRIWCYKGEVLENFTTERSIAHIFVRRTKHEHIDDYVLPQERIPYALQQRPQYHSTGWHLGIRQQMANRLQVGLNFLNPWPQRASLIVRQADELGDLVELGIGCRASPGHQNRQPTGRWNMDNRHLRILLVDDNKDAADMLALLLAQLGIECRTSYDGLTAVTQLAVWQADLVLLDLQMPGMDGFDTAIAMRALPGNDMLPIVALSGWDGGAERERFDTAQFAEQLNKPVQLDKLLHVIDRVTQRAL